MAAPAILRILLSEDDEFDELLFRNAVGVINIATDLSVVRDGKALMETLYREQTLPDVVFLDIDMPFKNGLECLMEIRHDNRLRELPVIIMSTAVQKKTIEITYELGANFFVTKPRSVSKLATFLEKALEWIREPQTLRQASTLSDRLLENQF